MNSELLLVFFLQPRHLVHIKTDKDPKKPAGMLRLVYEANPLAFLAREAGGAATDGRANILDMQPESLHQRTPLFIGSRAPVQKAAEFIEALD